MCCRFSASAYVQLPSGAPPLLRLGWKNNLNHLREKNVHLRLMNLGWGSLSVLFKPVDSRTHVRPNDYNNLAGREGPILDPFPPPLTKEKPFS